MSSIFEDIILNEKLSQEEIDSIKAGQTREERRNRERHARYAEVNDARAYDAARIAIAKEKKGQYNPDDENYGRRLSNRLKKKYYSKPYKKYETDDKGLAQAAPKAAAELSRRDNRDAAIKRSDEINNKRGFKSIRKESVLMDIEFK